jgi:coenzyme F420-reducing hydrogenase delta subunit
MITSLLDDFGVNPQRFQITWVSSAEPDKFVAAIKELTERVRKLGPHKTEAAQAA